MHPTRHLGKPAWERSSGEKMSGHRKTALVILATTSLGGSPLLAPAGFATEVGRGMYSFLGGGASVTVATQTPPNCRNRIQKFKPKPAWPHPFPLPSHRSKIASERNLRQAFLHRTCLAAALPCLGQNWPQLGVVGRPLKRAAIHCMAGSPSTSAVSMWLVPVLLRKGGSSLVRNSMSAPRAHQSRPS